MPAVGRSSAAARVAAAQELLAEEVAALRSGEDWQRFLGFQARLHRYSANNVLLIAAQHTQAYAAGLVDAPTPTVVAGFQTWKSLGRAVVRGQHGYVVLAPVVGVRRLAVDGDGRSRLLGVGERPQGAEVEDRRRVLRGFTVGHVFDVSQTAGAALPEVPRPKLLAGEAPAGLGEAAAALIERRGFAVGTVPDAAAIGGANGRTDWADRTVMVRSDMDDAAMVKTLVHEAAHVLLHDDPVGRCLAREVKEVEAESVAYVVTSAHGMDSGGYSFPYVAAWAGDDPAAVVEATARRVATAARAILDASPAEHGPGGRVPAAEAAVEADWGRVAPHDLPAASHGVEAVEL